MLGACAAVGTVNGYYTAFYKETHHPDLNKSFLFRGLPGDGTGRAYLRTGNAVVIAETPLEIKRWLHESFQSVSIK